MRTARRTASLPLALAILAVTASGSGAALPAGVVLGDAGVPAMAPAVALGFGATGHVAYLADDSRGQSPLDPSKLVAYCRLAPSDLSCGASARLGFALPAAADPKQGLHRVGRPFVLFSPPSRVLVVIGIKDSENGLYTDHTVLWESDQNGDPGSFSPGRIIGDLIPDSVALGPGEAVSLFAAAGPPDSSVPRGPTFQLAPIAGPAPGGFATLYPPSINYGSQQGGASVGVDSGRPLVAFAISSPLSWRAFGGAGDPNSSAGWSAPGTLGTAAGTIHIATGQSGTFALQGSASTGTALRLAKWDGTSFAPAPGSTATIPGSETPAQPFDFAQADNGTSSLYQDGAGNLEALWSWSDCVDKDGCTHELRVASLAAGGTAWSAPAVVGASSGTDTNALTNAVNNANASIAAFSRIEGYIVSGGPAGAQQTDVFAYALGQAVPLPGPAPGPPGGLSPIVGNATQSHLTWRLGNGLATFARSGGAPVGTTFSFFLNERAGVSFAFTQPAGGRRVGGRCRRPNRGNRGRPRCSYTATRGRLAFVGHPGTNRVSFQGRVSRSKRLSPGRYTLEITATHAAQSGSIPRFLHFRIVL